MRALIVAIALVVVGCSTPPDVSEVHVDWENYSPQVRERIGEAVRFADCEALQSEIDVAEKTDGNGDLVAYVEALAYDEGCYDQDR